MRPQIIVSHKVSKNPFFAKVEFELLWMHAYSLSRVLIKAAMILPDESISGWRPKMSKLGGLPNYTFEPHCATWYNVQEWHGMYLWLHNISG
jgi:hypothetical protein